MSKHTIKRVFKAFALSWRRLRTTVKKRPDPETYHARRETLETLRAADREGIIALRYFDEAG